MKIKKILLSNIRSYEFEEIVFDTGSTLLCGDIGSGKTSILLAIEFALFGLQPGQRGHALLRHAENSGGVKMECEIDETNVFIERTLKRGKTVSQDYCAITIDGDKRELSVSELKNKVLELLDYPLEFAKEQNLLYKFTVYTPQEEMKEIILQDAEARINTLRHIFGIDKYKRIRENIALLASKLREEKRIKEALTENLEEEKGLLLVKEEEVAIKQEEQENIARTFKAAQEKRIMLEKQRQELFEKVQEKNILKQEVEKTKILISTKENTLDDNRRLMKVLQDQLEEAKNNTREEKKNPQELEKKVISYEKERNDQQEVLITLKKKIFSLEVKIAENKKMFENVLDLHTCPTCLQMVDTVYKNHVKSNLEIVNKKNNTEMENLGDESKKLEKEITRIDEIIKKSKDELSEIKIREIKETQIKEKEARVKEIEQVNSSLEKDIALLSSHNLTLKSSMTDLSKFENMLQMKEEEVNEALKNEKRTEIKLIELKKEQEVFLASIHELQERIKEKEEIKKKMNYLIELENWLTKKFSSAIAMIERNVMVKLKKEFSELFSEWFSLLVPDNLRVKVDDDFTPIIEQEDYELDYAFLSGGEKTAVALAYRLALNQVINSLLSKVKTKDFLILDEPTDGFSEQQIDKIRDIFQELDVGQLIVVSHEQKMESFVEHIVRLKKDHGITAKSG